MSAGGTDTRTLDHVPSEEASASFLIAIDHMSSRTIRMPPDGVLQIGRSRDADVQINSDAVSRNHAKIVIAGGRVQIEDLGSHNGTLLNGERIAGTVDLTSGDVVAIADTLLILRTAARVSADAIDLDQMNRRIDQEIARATEYDRPFSVVVIRLPGSRPRAASALAALRPMDVLCFQGTTVIALLPELDPHPGREHGLALLAAIGPDAQGGIASYPADGCDTGTLLAAARSSMAMARPGELRIASSASIEHQLGNTRVVVADAAMVKLYDLIRRLARSDLTVLVTGETGAGKENAAVAVHTWSPRTEGPFVSLNCAALPESLAESELFGYERGAFTEAKAPKPGLMERAHGGTLFLDEVGDLSLGLQAKLLRALELKRITRLGDVREREVDVRIVAATNIDLDAAVAQGKFRQDLLFRISAATVAIPPLRHRRQEIPLLARMFVQLESQRLCRLGLELSESTLAELAHYDFPGNVRELKNAIDYAVATTEGPTIQPWDLPARVMGRKTDEIPVIRAERKFRPINDELRELERRRIIEALEAHDGVQTHAAAAIGMPLRTFTFRMRQYGIEGREHRK